MLLKLSSLSVASLHKLDDEANKFYFRKHDLFQTALTIRCYTQLNVLRPYIDSQINHIKHFIKFPFIIKVIDFIDLPSMFKDETVESSIPNYFEYSSKTLKFQCTLSDYAKNIKHCLI